MNSRLRVLIVLALVGGLLAAFNPGLNDFYAYVQKKMEASGNPADKPFQDLMAGISKEALKEAQEKGAVRKDYGIFSVFEINNVREKKIHKVLGFGKKVFIPLNETPKWDELKVDF